jgi:hypothetical protein
MTWRKDWCRALSLTWQTDYDSARGLMMEALDLI